MPHASFLRPSKRVFGLFPIVWKMEAVRRMNRGMGGDGGVVLLYIETGWFVKPIAEKRMRREKKFRHIHY